MAPPGAKTAPGARELNRHFGAETDLLSLQCNIYKQERLSSLNTTGKKMN